MFLCRLPFNGKTLCFCFTYSTSTSLVARNSVIASSASARPLSVSSCTMLSQYPSNSSSVPVTHLTSPGQAISSRIVCIPCRRSISQYPTHSKPPAFSSSERNPPIPAKILKDFISTNHLLPDFSNKKQSSFFSKLDRHIDIFISSSSVGSLSSLTIWKSSTPGITPSVLPLSKTQCTVPISSICSIFFVV